MTGGTGADVSAAKHALETLKRKLGKADAPKSCTVFLYGHAGRERAQRWRRMKFDAHLARNFRRDVVNATLSAMSANDEIEAYTFDDMVTGAVGFWKTSETPELAQWFQDVPAPNWPHVFDGDAEYLNRVKFHATVIPVEGASKALTVIRQRGGGSLVHKGGVMAFFDTTEHQFREAPGKVFHFDHGVDFFEWDGWVYILDHRKFESLTNIRSVTAAKAKECLQAIGSMTGIQVPGIELLNDAIATRPLLARKLASAQVLGITAMLTGKAMAERIKSKNLPIKFTETKNGYTFELDPTNASHVREFIYLVTDYYLYSPVTTLEYRVPAKYPA